MRERIDRGVLEKGGGALLATLLGNGALGQYTADYGAAG